ncbi:MAG TPA: hypothetical protein VNY24_02545 [Candidatus Acidoferrales bacterium]|jgi:hypothetical protein|nr:hypothetical protein [Candidatus Acidoferrales bacterium]
MGFDINLETESGEVLATICDPKNLLHRLLERGIKDEPHLAEIDWNGDTTFNRLQIPRFLSQWEAVARQARTSEDEAMVAEIKELAARCGGGVHLYLKFIGD